MVVCFCLQSKQLSKQKLRLRFGFLKKLCFFGCLLCKQKLRFFKKTKFFWLFALQTKASIALWFFKKTKFFWLFALQTKASIALRLRFGCASIALWLRFGCASVALRAKQSKAKQSKAKQKKLLLFFT